MALLMSRVSSGCRRERDGADPPLLESRVSVNVMGDVVGVDVIELL